MKLAISKKERPDQAAMAIKVHNQGGTWRHCGMLYSIKELEQNAERIVLTLEAPQW